MFMNQIYSKNGYIVFPTKNGYVVHNTVKTFQNGHTHMKYLNPCKTLIDICIHKKVPKTNNLYFLQSLIRISDDVEYIEKLEGFLWMKKNKIKENTERYTRKKR